MAVMGDKNGVRYGGAGPVEDSAGYAGATAGSGASWGVRRGLRVRDAQPSEYERVGDLTVDAYLGDGFLDRDDGTLESYAPLLRAVAERVTQAEVWVAADPGGEVLGTVTWCPVGSPWRELAHRPDQGEFRMLAVSPAARRRGVGRAMVQSCLTRARLERMGEVVLSSRSRMSAAHALYRGLGFGRAPELDHRPLDDVHLWAFRLTLRPRR